VHAIMVYRILVARRLENKVRKNSVRGYRIAALRRDNLDENGVTIALDENIAVLIMAANVHKNSLIQSQIRCRQISISVVRTLPMGWTKNNPPKSFFIPRYC